MHSSFLTKIGRKAVTSSDELWLKKLLLDVILFVNVKDFGFVFAGYTLEPIGLLEICSPRFKGFILHQKL